MAVRNAECRKCRKWGGLGWLGGTQGQRQCHAQQVWNMDESGLPTVQKPGKILAPKGKRQVGKMTSSERGHTTTVICAVSASGSYIPPLFIFARKRMNDQLMRGSPPGSIGMCTNSGWTDSEIFIKWLQHCCGTAGPLGSVPGMWNHLQGDQVN